VSDEIAVLRQLADQRIDLRERQLGLRATVHVAPDEAVGGHAQLHGRPAGVIDGDEAVLAGQREDAEDAADAPLAVVPMDLLAQRSRREG